MIRVRWEDACPTRGSFSGEMLHAILHDTLPDAASWAGNDKLGASQCPSLQVMRGWKQEATIEVLYPSKQMGRMSITMSTARTAQGRPVKIFKKQRENCRMPPLIPGAVMPLTCINMSIVRVSSSTVPAMPSPALLELANALACQS